MNTTPEGNASPFGPHQPTSVRRPGSSSDIARSATAAVTECTEVTDELVEAIGRLVGQLSDSSPPPDREQLERIVASPATALLVARDDTGGIVGSLTLVSFRIPTGLRTRIEDVVVDERARGKGVGLALNRAALEMARDMGAAGTDLTSRPSRAAANRLYQKMGFEQRDSNVYRYRHADPEPAP